MRRFDPFEGQRNGSAVIDLFVQRRRRRAVGEPREVENDVDARRHHRGRARGEIQRQFQRRIAPGPVNGIAPRRECLAQRRADKTGRSGDQTFHPGFVSSRLRGSRGPQARA